jgi:hypothetical protein
LTDAIVVIKKELSKVGAKEIIMKTVLMIAWMAGLFTILGNGGACHLREGAPSSEKLTNGVWGGEHIRAEVTDRGMEIEFDCAHGAIEQPIKLDSEGALDLAGKYSPQHPGPVRGDEENNEASVRYAGRVTNQELILTISDPNKKETIGTFTLRLGNEGRVRKCR